MMMMMMMIDDGDDDDDDHDDHDDHDDDDHDDHDDHDDDVARKQTLLFLFHVTFFLRISNQCLFNSVVVGETENLQIICLCNDMEPSSAQVYRDYQLGFVWPSIIIPSDIVSWDGFGVHSSASKENIQRRRSS